MTRICGSGGVVILIVGLLWSMPKGKDLNTFIKLKKHFLTSYVAAVRGDAKAQCYLGYTYAYGYGIRENHTKKIKWYRKAAEQGHATAQLRLGDCYFSGRGVTEDRTTAIKWYRKAADQGEQDAHFRLADLYHRGLGVAQDSSEALMWLRLVDKKISVLPHFIQVITNSMTAEQMDEAERRVAEWEAEHQTAVKTLFNSTQPQTKQP